MTYSRSADLRPIPIVTVATTVLQSLPERVLTVTAAFERPSPATVSIYGQTIGVSEYLALVNAPRSTGFLSERNINVALAAPRPHVERYRLLSTTAFGMSEEGIPLNPRMSSDDRAMANMTTLFGNVLALLANAVLPSSQSTYSTGWKRWIIYCAVIGTDRYLQHTPSSYYLYLESAPATIQISFPILACAGYMTWLVDHPTQPVAADPATKYLSAVRYHFFKSGMDISFYEKNPYLKAARAGLMKKWQSIPGNSIADHQTIPVPIQMLEIAAAETLDMDILNDHALFVALLFAYTFLCRVSEYLRRQKSNHHILSQSVVFWIKHLLPQDVTAVRPYLLVPSHDAWQYSKERMLGVTVTIKNGKADPGGKGFKTPIARPTDINPNRAYVISEVLWDLAVRAKPLKDQPFFSSSTAEPLNLSAEKLNKWLQEDLCPIFDLDPTRVHTHSLRFAGASVMHAANEEDSTIMRMGRWASLAFLSYIKFAAVTFSRVAASLADRTTMTIQDVRNLMTSA